ncbi:hypothetical protein [Methanopyrus sp. KOL6]|uniref:hypothetical protein n=1 Tax=Methanopyrus sp. KOL6 TaxID=1937004 RepID=UPI000B4B9B77|nr:hypothetical protein [Methanopyrus sp. KOL6]
MVRGGKGCLGACGCSEVRPGVIQSPDGTYVVRLALPPGFIKTEILRTVAELAERYASGEVHITVRQGLEIPEVPPSKLDDLLRNLRKLGLEPGSTGPRVRQVTCCPGIRTCANALMDPVPLAQKLHEEFVDVWVPAKVKIAVSGCPRGCTRPSENDLGLVAVSEDEWELLVGGYRVTRLPERDVIDAVESTLEWYSSEAPPGMRLRRFVTDRVSELRDVLERL